MFMYCFCLSYSFLDAGLRCYPERMKFTTITTLHDTSAQQPTAVSYDYLSNRDQNVYINNVLRQSIESTKLCINNKITKIEISFPEIINNDISVTESLNLNRAFVLEYIKAFTSYGKNLWVLFPDNKELNLALDIWDRDKRKNDHRNVVSVTSIVTASKLLSSCNQYEIQQPKVMVVVNPGFNVNEWIDVANLQTNSITIVINGNIDRLRNGYYPSIFYPTLAKVSNMYYQLFTQAFFIQSIAINGDRYGAWLIKNYPNKWMILIKNKDNSYGILKIFDNQDQKQPNAQEVWKTAKAAYQEIWGGLF